MYIFYPFDLVSFLHKFIVLIAFPSFTFVYLLNIGTESLFKLTAGLWLQRPFTRGSKSCCSLYANMYKPYMYRYAKMAKFKGLETVGVEPYPETNA